jgi:hypothetical protein
MNPIRSARVVSSVISTILGNAFSGPRVFRTVEWPAVFPAAGVAEALFPVV